MLDTIQKFLTQKNILSYSHHEISVVRTAGASEGLALAAALLQEVVTSETLLLLSGGRTPKELYGMLAHNEKIISGAVGMVDERFGETFHPTSNELMLKESGLLRYFEMRGISFYPILQNGHSREETAEKYDQTLRSLIQRYTTTVGILGIGLDGHTAGIPAKTAKLKIKSSTFYDDQFSLVSEYDDMSGQYGERVTMTFLGLSHLDIFIVLVFGEDKKHALEQVFREGSEEIIPGRFYTRPEIAQKTLLITDHSL